MANTGPGSAPKTGEYPAFGKVVSRMDVVDKLEPGDRVLRVILAGKR